MLKLVRVAVTGGIASGKSTVAGLFQKLGAYVVSADQIVHQFLSSHTALSKQVISLLGNGVLSEGCIDRKKVASAVFQNPLRLKQLEALIHPMVAKEIERLWAESAKTQKYPLFVAEVPLLFEAGQDSWYDVTVTVVAPEEACIKRFCATSGYDEEEYTRRAKLQFTQAEKAKKSTFVIENIGSVKELQTNVTLLFTQLSKGETPFV